MEGGGHQESSLVGFHVAFRAYFRRLRESDMDNSEGNFLQVENVVTLILMSTFLNLPMTLCHTVYLDFVRLWANAMKTNFYLQKSRTSQRLGLYKDMPTIITLAF
jgi:hypothetical protein